MNLEKSGSATGDDILGIISTINDNKETIKTAINHFLSNDQSKQLFIPEYIKIDVKENGAYINLVYKSYGMTLVFVCHSTEINPETRIPYDNRIHCKVINNATQQVIGYSGVYIDGNSFMFKPPGPNSTEVYNNLPYFFCIFNAINALYGKKLGGKKNIKNNLKTNTVLELKNICKNYKIKNYSKLNKDGLISLIKKTNK
jgi:hypothetical protein